MSYQKAAVAVLFGLLAIAANVVAQSTRRASVAKPDTPPAGALAVVNGQPITLNEIDPKVREVVSNLDADIAKARRNVLEAEINRLLLDAEAKKRQTTAEQLYETEVSSRVTAPTEAEIKAVYDANRDQIGAADLSIVRPRIVEYLRGQQEQKLASDLVARLRTSNTVVTGEDINAPNLAPGAVLATVDGRAVTLEALSERLKPVIYKLRLNAYELEETAINRAVNDMLLMAESKRRGVKPEDLIRAEITDKAHRPTDADVVKFYEENKERIKSDLASQRVGIAAYLERQEQERLETALASRLRAGASVRLLLAEPVPPVQTISAGNSPSRGDAKAPVTVVEFTDFQCPACKAMHPVLSETLKSYGNRVRFIVRNFPLDQHANARKAAEAAGAANAQGKFFEYIAVLFENQDALDVPSLKKYATQLGLDRARFDADLDKGVYAAQVRRDVADGEMYGVDSTPSIFINGVRLRDLSAEGLRTAIDRALGQTNQSPKRAAK